MIIPFVPEELFEISEDIKVTVATSNYIIIDNWYKNYEEIHHILQNMYVPRWKSEEESLNFKEYYDCRLKIANNYPGKIHQQNKQKIISLVEQYFLETDVLLFDDEYGYNFNYFKHQKQNIPNKLQHYPHVDADYGMVIYLDKFCSGGTALYDLEELPQNMEHKNILYDVSKIQKHVIEAKPNRCSIFNARIPHGGYIKSHNDYYYNWRINQVEFLTKFGI